MMRCFLVLLGSLVTRHLSSWWNPMLLSFCFNFRYFSLASSLRESSSGRLSSFSSSSDRFSAASSELASVQV